MTQLSTLAFTLEGNANGTPVPVVTKEVDMAVAGPFLLTKPDFSKSEVVKAFIYRCSHSLTNERSSSRVSRGGMGEGVGRQLVL